MEALGLVINSEELLSLSLCSLLAHALTPFVQLYGAFSPGLMSAATV